MTQGKARLLAAVLLAMVVAIAGVGAACGGSGGSSAGTPLEKATAILGHEPTGLAKTVVDRGKVVVASDADYPPQSSRNKDTGKLEGFDVDVAKRVAELLGLKVKFQTPAWETVPNGLAKGRFDVSIGSMPVASEASIGFTEPYYYTAGQAFVAKGGSQITSVKDLDGAKVGVTIPTTSHDFLEENSQAVLSIYPTIDKAFVDLRRGKIDFVVTALSTGQEAISSGQSIALSGKPLFYEDLAFATKKGEADWLALLSHAIRTMHEDGSLTAISKRWFGGQDLTVKQ